MNLNKLKISVGFILIFLITITISPQIIGGNSLFIFADSRPNIILIMTDDQAPFTIDFMPVTKSRLAEKGVVFTNATTSTPLCCPSRATFLTGQYAHNHGVLTNRLPNGGATIFDDSSTIATWLQSSGYQTIFLGKYLNGYDELNPPGIVPDGWDEWHVFFSGSPPHRYYYDYEISHNGEITLYEKNENQFSNDVLNRIAVEKILQSSTKPFFMVVSYYSPHQPFSYAARHQPLFRTDEEYSVRRPPNFNEEDISDKPEWMQSLDFLSPDYVDHIVQNSLRSLASVDDGVKRILDALAWKRKADNTVIIYASDNGVTSGEHRLANGKVCPYEECLHIPLIIMDPRLESPPYKNDQLVQNIDIAPTLADLAGVIPPHSVDGGSLVPLLSGPSLTWRNITLIEHWSGSGGGNEGALVELIPSYIGVRTETWKYVEYETGELELYNLDEDPFELTNLAYDSRFNEIIKELSLSAITLSKK